jgi:hypothetical protein
VPEHPMNSSYIPIAQRKSFFKRLMQRIKKSED